MNKCDANGCEICDTTTKSGCFGKVVWLILILAVLGGAAAGLMYFLE